MNKKQVILIVVLALVAGLVGGFVANKLTEPSLTPNSIQNLFQPSLPSQVISDEQTATIEAVNNVSPAVVSIIITKDLSKIRSLTGPDIFSFPDFFEFNSPFEFFFTPQQNTPKQQEQTPQKQEVGGGSGFIVSPDGLILTNKHVVSDQEAEYTVITNDGKEYQAKVVARDPVSDIAFVRIEAKDLPIVVFGDSDKIQIGQTVISIGFALGEYRNTVTKGVISGIGRTVVAGDGFGRSEVIEEALQTDAAINRGNSGGPLLNLKGEVIGINTAVNFQGQLIGFAIPINQAKNTLESVKKYGKITRAWLGVRYVILNPSIVEKNKLSVKNGALIIRGETQEELAVVPGSPADKAGLVENDIILEINNIKLGEEHSLVKEIAKYKAGEEVTLKVSSKGKEKILKVKLGEFPSD